MIKDISSDIVFIQMTDPQLGMITADKDFASETILWQQAIDIANHLKPDFVMITGDMVNAPGDNFQAAQAKIIMSKLNSDIDLHFIPGNHDIGDRPTSEILSWYNELFGDTWYCFDIDTKTNNSNTGDTDRWHFIALNSGIIHSPDNVPDQRDKQLQWLKDDLQQAKSSSPDRQIVVFMHHSLFLERPDEPDQYFNIPLQTRSKYLEMFQKYDVKAVFAGHLHQNRLARAGKMEMITTGPVGLSLGKDPSGLRIVKLHQGKLMHKYFSLNTPINDILAYTQLHG